jgi:hypothetical protein
MELVNATMMEAGYTMAVQPDGRELLVVVVKGTFTIPREETKEPTLAEEQVPLVMTDVFTGEPGFSAPRYEIDFAPRKPRCDVLLNGSAYAPGGKPVERVTVSLRVGSLVKSFDVVGNRTWQASLLTLAVSKTEPFTVMPISYNNAFGGTDKSQGDPSKYRYYPTNHAGAGYHEYVAAKNVNGKPLPNTEETGQRVTSPIGKYRPMALGPLGRAWQQRVKLAGTYDKNWQENVFPFLPADFDERYYQAAPADQQTDYLRGGEEVELVNLTPRGRSVFELPAVKVPFEFFYKNGDRKKLRGVTDTLVLEPDQGRFTISARACLPLRRSLHEIRLAVAGRLAGDWYAEQGLEPRPAGKPRFKSLAELAALNPVRRRRQ